MDADGRMAFWMDDYVKRKAAIAVIDKLLSKIFTEPVGEKLMENVPSEDVRPVVRGHWIFTTERFTPEKICSACLERYTLVACEPNESDPYNKMNFCPNCGADIRESK